MFGLAPALRRSRRQESINGAQSSTVIPDAVWHSRLYRGNVLDGFITLTS
uniref:Uncharacterized protein n=1 Tax=Arion vulgaris TaxID=1028688 RepID=A0A0B6XUW4_9EUPU